MSTSDEKTLVEAISTLQSQKATIDELRLRIAAIEAQNALLIEKLANARDTWMPNVVTTGSSIHVGSACLHDNCPTCHGTGMGPWGPCVHMISCPCQKCSPRA